MKLTFETANHVNVVYDEYTSLHRPILLENRPDVLVGWSS